jgi:hypothetical protein
MRPIVYAVKDLNIVDWDPLQVQLEEAFLQLLELHCVETEKEAEQLDSTYLSRYSQLLLFPLVDTPSSSGGFVEYSLVHV